MDAAAVTHGTVRQCCSSKTSNRITHWSEIFQTYSLKEEGKIMKLQGQLQSL